MDFWHSLFLYLLLLCGMAGNLILPYCWGKVWRDYDPLRKDTILLSDPDSPVRWFQRLWRVVLGTIFILGGIMMGHNLQSTLFIDIITQYAMIGYGVFGCILPAFLSLTDIKYVDSKTARVHNLFYLFGHICLQITSLCMAATAFELGHDMRGAIFSILCLITIFLFAIYNMSDRLECRDTIIGYEGIWEFLFHLLAYFPIGYTTILFLLS
ncbi:MAG: DUF998 domain-containing protein [Oscillospiraceae bacterium]|nr:DUF998 domain-containing protein [Oscillospiraceae bacterium]